MSSYLNHAIHDFYKNEFQNCNNDREKHLNDKSLDEKNAVLTTNLLRIEFGYRQACAVILDSFNIVGVENFLSI